MRWAAYGPVALLLAGCAAGGATTSTHPQPTRAVVLDDGALRVQPAPDAKARVPETQVQRDLVLTNQTIGQLDRLILGRITWHVAGNVAAVPDDSLAWVYIYKNAEDIDHGAYFSGPGCGMAWPMPGNAPADPSEEHALVVDASTGASLEYIGSGPGACGPYQLPHVTDPLETLSVPWAETGPDTVTVNVPPCGNLAGGTGGPRIEFIATVPLGEHCSSPGVDKVFDHYGLHSNLHSSVGLICAVLWTGVHLSLPSGCIRAAG
jgi:hypothetical protein